MDAAKRPGPATGRAEWATRSPGWRPGGMPDRLDDLPARLKRPPAGHSRRDDGNSGAISQSAGAPADLNAMSAVRFAAEWSTTRAGARRNSLLRVRRRAGGGAMAGQASPDLEAPSEPAFRDARDHVAGVMTPPAGSGAAGGSYGLPDAGPAPPGAQRYSRPWPGAGGRWVMWVLRAVVWAILTGAPLTGQGTAGRPAAASGGSGGRSGTAASGFPSGLAAAYALQFGQVYLNFSAATAAHRARELAAFLPSGSDPQLGWNGAGVQRLESEQVVSVTVAGPRRAVVTLLARVNGRLMELGVPIYAARGGMVVSGEPAWLPAPPAVTPAGGSAAATDPAAAASLSGQLPVFFRAYASGDRATLTRFAAPGSKITSLNGAVSFGSIESMTVPQGGSTRTITVTVKWLLPAATRREAQPAPAPAAIEMTYQLTVVRQGTSWYVRAIGPAADQPGPP